MSRDDRVLRRSREGIAVVPEPVEILTAVKQSVGLVRIFAARHVPAPSMLFARAPKKACSQL
ncbi:hypothetical protein GCM10027194_35020 [Thalassiella azotivora]